MASMLEVARAGADYLDVAMEPLSWGMVHPDLLSVHALMKDAGFDVPDINMNAYMKVRSLTQEFIDDFLGHFIDPRNKQLSSLLIGSGLPGGMMGSLMADLKGAHRSINASLKSRGQAILSEDELMVKMFNEVEHIWPKLGYPPLVTPFSQYVKNMAIMNILQMAGGKERYTMIDNNTWDMILGKAGTLPGPLDPEIHKLAQAQGKEFYKGVPQEAYPDELDKYRKEMRDNNWDAGPDDEELFELAMHDKQYRDYRSGIAKSRFEAELAKAKEMANPVVAVPLPAPEPEPVKEKPAEVKLPPRIIDPDIREILSPAKGQVIYNLFGEDTEFSTPGENISRGARLCYLQTSAYIGEIICPYNGVISEIVVQQGANVKKGEVLFRIKEVNREINEKAPARKTAKPTTKAVG
jgi:pyruvate carboxylase subunit B